MSSSRLDAFEVSRFGRAIIRPSVAVLFYLIAVVGLVLALGAFWLMSQQAHNVAASADRKSRAAVAAVSANNKKLNEPSRLAICYLISVYSQAGKSTPDLSPAQGIIFPAWAALGKTPALHCSK